MGVEGIGKMGLAIAASPRLFVQQVKAAIDNAPVRGIGMLRQCFDIHKGGKNLSQAYAPDFPPLLTKWKYDR